MIEKVPAQKQSRSPLASKPESKKKGEPKKSSPPRTSRVETPRGPSVKPSKSKAVIAEEPPRRGRPSLSKEQQEEPKRQAGRLSPLPQPTESKRGPGRPPLERKPEERRPEEPKRGPGRPASEQVDDTDMIGFGFGQPIKSQRPKATASRKH